MISIEVMTSPSIIVSCVYVPPNCSDTYFNATLQALEVLASRYHRLLILGDFNCSSINWDQLSSPSTLATSLCDFVFRYNLAQVINRPTHLKGNILDLIITNLDNHISDLVITDSANLVGGLQSDHSFISFSVCTLIYSHQAVSRHVFDFSKANFDAINDYLLDLDFTPCSSFSHVDQLWGFLSDLILQTCSKFIPKVKVKSHEHPPWFNSNIRHHLNRIHSLHRKVKSRNTPHLSAKLILEEQHLQNLMCSAKCEYESSLLRNCKLSHSYKSLFRYINSFSKSHDLPNHAFLGDTHAFSSADIANHFNSFFFSVYQLSSIYDLDTVNLCTSIPISDQLQDMSVEECEVYHILSSLNPSKAMGIDSIDPKILKYCACTLCSPVSVLFNKCLSDSCIPSQWKVHIISPILKCGDPSNVANYRPISLLCSLSKVLERLIFDRVYEYVLPSLSVSQFGFMQNRSSLQQLLTVLQMIYANLHDKVQTDIIYLDFAKAFDSISHSKLLIKLWRVGITGRIWQWFKCYLSGRSQFVSIDGILSSSRPVTSGVPQGSILGPLLFSIYINDLPDYLSFSSPLLFADDTKCIGGISSPVDHALLQSDLVSLQSWCTAWDLSFNSSKCKSLSISMHSQSTVPVQPYSISSSDIVSVDHHKDLGIIFTSNLTWNLHRLCHWQGL